MEIVCIETETFEAMLTRLETLARHVDALNERYGRDKAMKEWLDAQEVCTILNICPRTLQGLRTSGALACTQINHKIWYKPEDVAAIIKSQTVK